VLAAGASKRMGVQKLLLPVEGKPVVCRIVDALAGSSLGEICVVVGHEADRVTRELHGRPARCVLNQAYREGMLSSVRCGLRALPPACTAVLVALGDQPWLTTELVNDLITSFRRAGPGILVPAYQGRRGHPLLFARTYEPEIMTRFDTAGLRGLLHAHPEAVAELSVDTPSVLDDMDTPGDYSRSIRRYNELRMVPFHDAYDMVVQAAPRLPVEKIRLEQALGRTLARDVTADRDVPPARLSTMDGFACRRADCARPLGEVETIPAGALPTKSILEGQCARIMTGALLPDGADTIVMREHTVEKDGRIHVTGPPGQRYFREQGEDLRAGQRVLRAGTVIQPETVAVLASVGCDPVPVSTAPTVAVVSTGNELLPPREAPSRAQLRDSNSFQLAAQVTACGAVPERLGILQDTPEAIRDGLTTALDRCDVVLSSGGASAGDFDFVPAILRRLGVDVAFDRVALRPGKPTVFGRKGDRAVFALPGNPVSAFVVFELFVRPFLLRMMGADASPFHVQGALGHRVTRRETDRTEFLPVTLSEDMVVRTVAYHGSAHIHAYVRADGMICLPAGTGTLAEGAAVPVRLLTGRRHAWSRHAD
jgi:molybdopterin molybdotransferase